MTNANLAQHTIKIPALEIQYGDRSHTSAIFPDHVGEQGTIEVVGLKTESTKDLHFVMLTKWAFVETGASTEILTSSHPVMDSIFVTRQFAI